MNTIFKHVAEIAFLVLVLTACGAFATGLLEAKDFMSLAGMAAGAFFALSKPKNDTAI